MVLSITYNLSELLDDIIVIIVMTNHTSDKQRDWAANKDTGLALHSGQCPAIESWL